ncbi:MAG: DNA polymerase III subunit gamma/tau [Lactovum sp.]
MVYQALYRKYRSQRFDEMVGQEVIATTLKNAIINEQISHAYLFNGPRGTGKTSAAKIFAKAINCPQVTQGEPCNSCDICVAITAGRLEDIIEFDAASNNGVEEIREIREKSTYTTSLTKYKVYIIDEVHMLSKGAFNALLKTLEEPTEYVVFILATTEIQKIPATIISRVQRFNFKSITNSDISTHLAAVLADEKIEYEPAALEVIARSAEGGMRDALSLLDQVLSFSAGNLTEKDAFLVTGAIADEILKDYIQALSSKNRESALEKISQAFSEGKNMLRFAEDLLRELKDLLFVEKQEISSNLIYAWIDIVIGSLKMIKETSQTKVAADVMTMRLLDFSLPQTPQAVNIMSSTASQTSVEKLKIKKQQRKIESDEILNLLDCAVKEKEYKKQVVSIWPELIEAMSNPSNKALMKKTIKLTVVTKKTIILIVEAENLINRVVSESDIPEIISRFLEQHCGFSPEILILTQVRWKKLREDYKKEYEARKENLTSDNETTEIGHEVKEEIDLLDYANKHFPDKVVEIQD